MSDFPNPKCSSCAKPEGQTKGCTLWSSFFGSRWLVQRTLKFSVICQYFSATAPSISYLSESQLVWVLSGLVLLVSLQRHWQGGQGRQRYSEHIRNFLKLETWKLKVSARALLRKVAWSLHPSPFTAVRVLSNHHWFFRTYKWSFGVFEVYILDQGSLGSVWGRKPLEPVSIHQ